jgi:hypothetical protein
MRTASQSHSHRRRQRRKVRVRLLCKKASVYFIFEADNLAQAAFL